MVDGTVKEVARQLVEQLPNNATWEDLLVCISVQRDKARSIDLQVSLTPQSSSNLTEAQRSELRRRADDEGCQSGRCHPLGASEGGNSDKVSVVSLPMALRAEARLEYAEATLRYETSQPGLGHPRSTRGSVSILYRFPRSAESSCRHCGISQPHAIQRSDNLEHEGLIPCARSSGRARQPPARSQPRVARPADNGSTVVTCSSEQMRNSAGTPSSDSPTPTRISVRVSIAISG